jgi:endonuclease/exonuclease/phosphatase (EEP) superfamily protein YafD
MIADANPGFARRLLFAGVNLLVPLHTGVIVVYYVSRWLSGGDFWLTDALGYVLPWLFLPLAVLLPASLLRRYRPLQILALVPAVLFLLTYGHLYLPRPPVHPVGPTLTVLTHNVLYTNVDADGIATAVEAHEPDFFALRELEPPLSLALDTRFAADYPHHRFEPGCGFWSRHPILAYEAFQLVPGEGDWTQQFLLDVEGDPVTVLSVHPRSPPLRGFHLFGLALGVPTGFANEQRDADVRGLLARLEGMERPVILIGDFNLTDQQSLYQRLTQHLHDSHRESGWGMGFTFTRFPRVGLPMWRIDYVFHSPDLVALSTTVEDFGGSDHRPVIARLAFRGVERD